MSEGNAATIGDAIQRLEDAETTDAILSHDNLREFVTDAGFLAHAILHGMFNGEEPEGEADLWAQLLSAAQSVVYATGLIFQEWDGEQ